MIGDLDHFDLILNCTAFKVPSQFYYLSTINQNIYKILVLNHEYVIQSSVNKKTFEMFIRYMVKREIPDLDLDNIDQFEKLSEEFDVMKDIIQIFRKNPPKQNISTLLDTNSSLKTKLHDKKNLLKNKTIKYAQTIHHLFNNSGICTSWKLQENKRSLYQACHQENIKFVELLTKKEVIKEDGLTFVLNIEEKTAILFRNLSTKSEIFIPRTINYNSTDFIVTTISEGCFSNSKNIKKIEFDSNSEVNLIDDYSFANSSLEEITIPSSVTKIGEGSFYLCNKLQNVCFLNDSKLKTIGKLAFAKSSLKLVSIPRNVVEICEKAFHDCGQFNELKFAEDCKLRFIKESAFYRTRLTSLTVPKSVIQIGKYSFSYCKKLNSLNFLNACSIEDSAFTYSNLKSIRLASSVYLKDGWCDSIEKLVSVSINKEEEENIQFFDEKLILGKSDSKSGIFDVLLFVLRDVKEVTIPPCIRHIGSHSLANCELLEKVEFSDDSKLKTIGISAFQNCSLETITLPKQVTRIFMYGFAYSDKIKSIKFSELFTIDGYCFSWSNLTSLTIPSSVGEFKEGWCCGTESLVDITVFSTSMRNITYFDDKFILAKSDPSNDVFDVLIFARRDVKEAKIPSFIKTIENYAFDCCKSLQSVIFEENSQLKTLGQYAFSGSSMRKIDLPQSLTKIDEGCFTYCENLEELNFSKDSELVSFERSLFSYSSLKKLTIPSNIANIDEGCWMTTTNIKKIDIFLNKNEKNILYFDDKFILGKSDHSSDVFDVLIFARRDIKEAKIPSFIKRIESFSFDECKQLQRVTFAEDSELKSIGQAAFAGSSIEQIFIPDNITRICKYTFSNCYNLRSIVFSDKSQLNTIEKDALIISKLDCLYIPKHVKEICECTFSGCKNIKIIEIDENSELFSINKKAFDRSYDGIIIMFSAKLRNLFFFFCR
ncbi:beta-1,3-glucan linked protein [Tritrichomonas musculus]|uniref:Beta-1,3-glucan linked protein n=1 Tax=Tritrichomonas musculus TaxID=1915356 RepID=A0ABR2GXU0_9EUKA